MGCLVGDSGGTLGVPVRVLVARREGEGLPLPAERKRASLEAPDGRGQAAVGFRIRVTVGQCCRRLEVLFTLQLAFGPSGSVYFFIPFTLGPLAAPPSQGQLLVTALELLLLQ